MPNLEENKPVFDLPEEDVAPLSSGGTSSILLSKPVNFDLGEEYSIPNNIPSTPVPSITSVPKQSLDNSDYLQGVKDELSKGWKSVLENSVDKYKYQKAYSYNPETETRQTQNFERYYQHPSYEKLGFNPWRDNETLYNQQGSAAGDLWRATKSAAKLYYTGFVSPLRSYADLFTGSPGKLDYDSEKEMRQANIVGGSTRGGVGGFASNLLVNTGYTLGIASEIAAEWLASAALAPETGGASVGVTAARTGNTLRKIFSAGKVGEGLNLLKNFDATKAAYNSLKGVAKFVNPLEHTVDVYKAIKAAPELSNLTKVSKTAAGLYRDVIMANAVASEAKMEGASAFTDMRQQLLDEYYEKHGVAASGEDYENILDKAYDAGQSTLKWNLPAIFLTNKITFGNMFGKFANLEKYATRSGAEFALKKGVGFETIKPGIQSALKGLLKPKTYGKASLNYFKGNLSEGLQESIQEVISGAAKDYYTNLYYNPSKQGMSYALGDVGENVKKQFGEKGFETFASGFFMGGLIGGFGHVARGAKIGGLKAYDAFTGSNRYETYRKLKAADAEEKAAVLNQIYKNPLQYFGKGILNYSNNATVEAGKNAAQVAGDQKTWQDWTDQSIWGQVTTALDTNTYGVFLEQLDKIAQMDKDSIKEAYGIDGEEVLSKIGKIKERAEKLKDTYEEWSDKYPNPFNPKAYKEGTPERRTEELAYNSWNHARNIGIFYNHSYERNKERVKSVINEVGAKSPVADVLLNDLMPLMDPRSLKKTRQLLRQEISSLRLLASDPKTKKELKEKKRRLELLKNYESALVDHFTVEELAVQAKEGETLPVRNTQQSLNAAYEEYLKHLTKVNQVPFIKKDSDQAFSKIVDIHRLNIDNVNLTASVNLLEDSKGFYDFYDRLNKTQTEMFDSRQEDFEESVKKAQERVELNSMLQALFERGIVVPQEYLDALVQDKTVPKEFYDVAAKQVVTENDPRYEVFASLVKDFVVVNKPAPKVQPAEQAQQDDLETKKADIERRRQQELDNSLKLKELQPVLENSIDEATGQSATDALINAGGERGSLSVLGNKQQSSYFYDFALTVEEGIEADRINNLPPSRERKAQQLELGKKIAERLKQETLKEINAKYDAELAALSQDNGKKQQDLGPNKAAPVHQIAKKAQDMALIEIKSRLDKVSNGEELEALEQTIDNEITAREYLSDGVEELIAARREQLSTSFKFEDIKKGEILLLNDKKWGKVRVLSVSGGKIKVRRLNEEVGGVLVIAAKDIHRDIKFKYSKGMKNEPVKLSAKDKQIAAENLKNNEKFLSDVNHAKKLADEADKKTQEQVDKEFFDNLGCK